MPVPTAVPPALTASVPPLNTACPNVVPREPTISLPPLKTSRAAAELRAGHDRIAAEPLQGTAARHDDATRSAAGRHSFVAAALDHGA